MPKINMDNKTFLIPMVNTAVLFFSSSKANRITASTTFNDNTGINNETVVEYMSYVPYSSVDNILVYNGIRIKLNILVPKLLIVNNPIFLNKYLYLFILFDP